MTLALPPEAVNGLLEVLHAAQQGVRAALYALGLTAEVHGQPGWPFAHRLAAEMLVVDASLARGVVLSLLCAAAALLALLASLCWRRARDALWLVATALLVFAPWPQARLVFAPAVATSLHRSPAGFSAHGIVRGQRVYRDHCRRCHGEDGRGDGPDAVNLPMWPPTLDGALTWKRLEGELFWRVRHGMRARDGALTMPGFAVQLSDAQVWEVLDYLQAHAAGRILRRSGAWEHPVRMPDAGVRCVRGVARSTRELAGRRLRVVLPGTGELPADDLRLVSLVVGQPEGNTDPECRTDEPEAVAALALLLGVSPAELPGHQLIVDRAGWLRARGQPGKAGWSEDDLVCRSLRSPQPRAADIASRSDGLDLLIRRMDAEPVRLVRGGFPH